MTIQLWPSTEFDNNDAPLYDMRKPLPQRIRLNPTFSARESSDPRRAGEYHLFRDHQLQRPNQLLERNPTVVSDGTVTANPTAIHNARLTIDHSRTIKPRRRGWR
ncbi:MAG: hypothetical protein WBW04_13930, partial [Nitrolancea sp.]